MYGIGVAVDPQLCRNYSLICLRRRRIPTLLLLNCSSENDFKVANSLYEHPQLLSHCNCRVEYTGFPSDALNYTAAEFRMEHIKYFINEKFYINSYKI